MDQRSVERARSGDKDLFLADLREANLQGVGLDWADLRGANLERTDLRRVNLAYTNLDGAQLQGADLRGAKLDGASLVNARLVGAVFNDDTRWPSDIDPKLIQSEQDEITGARRIISDELFSSVPVVPGIHQLCDYLIPRNFTPLTTWHKDLLRNIAIAELGYPELLNEALNSLGALGAAARESVRKQIRSGEIMLSSELIQAATLQAIEISAQERATSREL